MQQKLRKYKVKNNIKQILEKKGMMQIQLAKMTGLDPTYLNRLINQEMTPSLVICLLIARALREPVEEVFYITEGSNR